MMVAMAGLIREMAALLDDAECLAFATFRDGKLIDSDEWRKKRADALARIKEMTDG